MAFRTEEFPSGPESRLMTIGRLDQDPIQQDANSPILETSPPILETSPPILEKSPPILEKSPPILETSPPILEKSPPHLALLCPAIPSTSCFMYQTC